MTRSQCMNLGGGHFLCFYHTFSITSHRHPSPSGIAKPPLQIMPRNCLSSHVSPMCGDGLVAWLVVMKILVHLDLRSMSDREVTWTGPATTDPFLIMYQIKFPGLHNFICLSHFGASAASPHLSWAPEKGMDQGIQ